MSLVTYLDNLASQLIIRDVEKEGIERSLSYLKDNLQRYFGSAVEEYKVFGSYQRSTILPRKADEKSDIDFMIVFNNSDSFRPQTYLDRLRKFTETYYPNSIVRQSHPTIVLELGHIKFELVPAYQDIIGKMFNSYFIPSRESNYTQWSRTNPTEFNKEVDEKNRNHSSKIKPVIRLVKYWNADVRAFSSYELENMIINQYYILCYNTKDYFYKAFDAVRCDWNDSQGKKDKVNRAKDTLNRIKEYESKGWTIEAEKLLSDLLPPLNSVRR